jgi:hypothetical protein
MKQKSKNPWVTEDSRMVVLETLNEHYCRKLIKTLVNSSVESIEFRGVYMTYYNKIIRALGNGDTKVIKLILAFDEELEVEYKWVFLQQALCEFFFAPTCTVEVMIIRSIGADPNRIEDCLSHIYFYASRPFPPNMFITCPLPTQEIERSLAWISGFQVSGKVRQSIFSILPKKYGRGGELCAIWKLPKDLFKMVWKCFFK